MPRSKGNENRSHSSFRKYSRMYDINMIDGGWWAVGGGTGNRCFTTGTFSRIVVARRVFFAKRDGKNYRKQ